MIWRTYGALMAQIWRSGGRFAPKYGPKGPFIMAQHTLLKLVYGALYGALMAQLAHGK